VWRSTSWHDQFDFPAVTLMLLASFVIIHPWKGVMTVNEVLCKGCGACAAACPSGAMTLSHFTHDQILAQLETLVV